MHNTNLPPQEIYCEYKNRGEIEQFFDHLKNTLDASSSNMQREESLNGWMFINHLSMQIIYKLYVILKTTTLNKKQKLNHKYSINDTIEHLKSINKIKFRRGGNIIDLVIEMNNNCSVQEALLILDRNVPSFSFQQQNTFAVLKSEDEIRIEKVSK